MPAVGAASLRDASVRADPHPFFHRLRARDPVQWSEPSRAWLVTSHAEVCAGFREPRLSSDRLSAVEAAMSARRRGELAETFELLRGWMVFRDPPVHERLRDPVRRAFTPRRVERLAPRVRARVDALLDRVAGRETCELVEALAYPLPAIVIAELLGVPAADRERFQLWSRKLSGVVFGVLEGPGAESRAAEATAEFADYFGHLIRRKQREPGDDLVSALVAAADAPGGLPPERLVGACTLLLFAGHETTTALIANGAAVLLEHPDALARLRAQPKLLRTAVEELLRFEGPAQIMVRRVAEPFAWGDHRLQEGQRVFLALAAANRDPAVFPDPDRLDVTRDPNPHLAFGHGLHFCLGAALARLETRIALGSLLERFPALSLAEPVTWTSPGVIGRGVPGVHVKLR